MSDEFTPQQLDLLRQFLAEKQEAPQPSPPKRFSKAWGQQPMHLFFDAPQLYNPPAQHVRRGDAWYERAEFHRAYQEYATACTKLRVNGWLCKGLATLAEPGLFAFVVGVGASIFSNPDKLEWYFLFNRLALCALRAKNYGLCQDNVRHALEQIRKDAAAYVIGSLAAAAIGDEFSARAMYGQAEVYNPEIDEFC